MSRCLISFSGGETSAYMTWRLLREPQHAEYLVVFANTGQEREETLEFVKACDDFFGFNTVWIEAVQHEGRVAPTHRVVSFTDASRDGAPFEGHIRKYGIPNSKYKDCTRGLKQIPIESYARSVGWELGSYDLAIGIRIDEVDRVQVQSKRRLIYPLITPWRVSKPQINSWWEQQKFRLRLRSYQGNCKWCWKKSLRKHYTIIDETPEAYDFPKRMEQLYGNVGPEFGIKKRGKNAGKPALEGYRRKFFRGNVSTLELFEQYKQLKVSGGFTPAQDESTRRHVSLFNDHLDVGGGCSESCEVFDDADNVGEMYGV